MRTKPNIIEYCHRYVQTGYRFMYPNADAAYGETVGTILTEVSGLIANSDASYHDLEHTIQVILVGQEILKGRQMVQGDIPPETWFNFTIALICHDVGYCRGVCQGDRPLQRRYATGQQPVAEIFLPEGATDASLSACHVDRSKLFVAEQFGDRPPIQVPLIQDLIERTRLKIAPADPAIYHQSGDLAGLAQAADLIGQLGDPAYLPKMANLFEEFEETGSNQAMGYHRPADLRNSYPKFYWNIASPFVYPAVRYLELTQSGQSILQTLYRNVATVEAELNDPGRKAKAWVMGVVGR
ncbi:MAG: metal-dependent phosphohydrolase [Synechococcales cyanobacterium RM1_1_8]|nr:metal-dependent phosphohydrolase [Synechococcales cyanobacterium RM1_1_8]